MVEVVSEARSHGGRQLVLRHDSRATGTPMTFSLFLPPQAEQGRVPLVTYLSGLTCTHANVTDKGEYRAACAELGLAFLAPDTSPRGDGVADEEGWDIGLGAGFYVDATEAPWSAHYRMWSYVTEELPALVAAEYAALDMSAQAITGHSMGGHGALTVALRHPGRFHAVSAFAPIVAPSEVPWGEKAFSRYLGPDRAAWRAHDAVALIEDGARVPAIRIDIGAADPFLERELRPERIEAAAADAGIELILERRSGYDHSYFFISTFLAEHLRWMKSRLG
ncbi:S-formylglutathione hydrolase [Sphingomonas astaxanthinifaciens]|uniref:S-formylglutathione hydrolase n=1 Tax=Sphingomonas astaxanthinifaciens DSM 22298 TaxID=1123267 RepID=A0ABQ5Z534_9SPHN|nr:S-formylglutathione hydrolase [Sphingomonas astaxanthinifaciens]GLR47117.1 S-formylglutathione hydrolase [Sphingomonas astaxanthinifaciens DSM 22298]